MPAVRFKELAGTSATEGESSAEIRGRVVRARERQRERLRGEGIFANAQMSPRLIRKYCRVDEECERLLEAAMTRLGLSARAYDRILKVSRTIADLDSAEEIRSGDTSGRAAALRSVVESGAVFNSLYNDAFVLMQYYGYLRRNPDDAPDGNFSGYDFWLAKLNSFSQPGEDVRIESVALARAQRAEMVRAFVESAEYRQRFGGAAGGNQLGAIEGSDAGP